ncbi:MAG: heavy metal translocating P-type ATPase [Synergistetes bacterium]|nr:heavy metal translocating P-type ATPase [Synergistota bacterium]MDW8192393.1 heavy metal translocating P-type ATPase [Synergistota bacterium]
MRTYKKLSLIGLDCPNCAVKIEKDVKGIKGVKDAIVSLSSQKLTLTIEEESSWPDILNQVKLVVNKYDTNIKVLEKDLEDKHKITKEIIKLALGTSPFVIAFLANGSLKQALFILSYIAIGHSVLLKAFKNILSGQVFDENLLMSIATSGALLIGEVPEAISVMLFYKIGELLQNIAVENSRRSITALLDLRPEFANLLIGNETKKTKAEAIKIGDTIIVRPGERIPLDGIVIEGSSSVDTSTITGESMPRSVTVGNEVLAGFINLDGLLKIKVTKEFKESTISKILELVENASARKARTENFITKFARFYTPIVILLALLIALIPPMAFGRPFSLWIYRALVFLVVSCPCALLISIPLGFFAGIGSASRNGILMKGSNYLEALNDVNTIIFDKTGTLTMGRFKIKNIWSAKGYEREDILNYAAHAEFYSNHPIAQSILNEYSNIDETKIKEYREIPGFGVEAKINDKRVLVGNAKLLSDRGIDIDKEIETETGVYVAINDKLAGYITFEDEIKKDAKETIDRLKEIGIKTVLFTGDHKNAAKYVAESLGIDEFYHDLLPHQKVEKLEELKTKKSRGNIIFAGDGINDAAVIARADIGIAMGALGQDAAIEAADVVIMNDQIKSILTAIHIARKTKKIVWQNIFLALSIKFLVLITASLGMVNMWEAVFADVGVALMTILNSLRITNENFD